MKKQNIKALVSLSLLLSLPAVYVYAQGKTLIREVEIPFDFSVRDKTLPAGAYSVAWVNSEKSMFRLRNEDSGEAIVGLATSVQAKGAPKTAKLLFRRYGETYFLFQIWEPGNVRGRQLPKSRTERSTERNLAKRGEEPSTVDLVPSP